MAAITKRHRRRVRRALENPDLSFCLDKQDYHPQCFFELYAGTMQRNEANKKYFFSPGFFEMAFRTFGESISFWRINYKDDIASGWLILRYGDLAYAWLSGNKEEYFHLFPTNSLVYDSILQLKKEGIKYFILGGGRSAEKDSSPPG